MKKKTPIGSKLGRYHGLAAKTPAHPKNPEYMAGHALGKAKRANRPHIKKALEEAGHTVLGICDEGVIFKHADTGTVMIRKKGNRARRKRIALKAKLGRDPRTPKTQHRMQRMKRAMPHGGVDGTVNFEQKQRTGKGNKSKRRIIASSPYLHNGKAKDAYISAQRFVYFKKALETEGHDILATCDEGVIFKHADTGAVLVRKISSALAAKVMATRGVGKRKKVTHQKTKGGKKTVIGYHKPGAKMYRSPQGDLHPAR